MLGRKNAFGHPFLFLVDRKLGRFAKTKFQALQGVIRYGCRLPQTILDCHVGGSIMRRCVYLLGLAWLLALSDARFAIAIVRSWDDNGNDASKQWSVNGNWDPDGA